MGHPPHCIIQKGKKIMGLFTNKKKICPICGNPTPRLFPQEFDGQPICKECEKNIDLPREVLNSMTMHDFREYLAAYEENKILRSVFHATYHYGGDSLFSKECIVLDEANGLIRLKDSENCWVIEKQYLKSFRILEDNNVLFESGEGTLNHYMSEIPTRVRALESLVMAYYAEKSAYERRRDFERLRNINESEEERRERERIDNDYSLRFHVPELFQNFRVEITFTHRYWTWYEEKSSAPVFDEWYPSVDDYLEKYKEKTDELQLLADKLMQMIDPSAGKTQICSAETITIPVSGIASVDTVAEIKKYKELLEQGIITEEEFSMKKKQLLGI